MDGHTLDFQNKQPLSQMYGKKKHKTAHILQGSSKLGKNTQIVNKKVILIGDTAVGKTSLMYRFVQNKFLEEGCPTVNASFRSKDVIISTPKGR